MCFPDCLSFFKRETRSFSSSRTLALKARGPRLAAGGTGKDGDRMERAAVTRIPPAASPVRPTWGRRHGARGGPVPGGPRLLNPASADVYGEGTRGSGRNGEVRVAPVPSTVPRAQPTNSRPRRGPPASPARTCRGGQRGEQALSAARQESRGRVFQSAQPRRDEGARRSRR